MNETGLTVYLKVSVEELAKRLEICKSTRPVLKDAPVMSCCIYCRKPGEKNSPLYESFNRV